MSTQKLSPIRKYPKPSHRSHGAILVLPHSHFPKPRPSRLRRCKLSANWLESPLAGFKASLAVIVWYWQSPRLRTKPCLRIYLQRFEVESDSTACLACLIARQAQHTGHRPVDAVTSQRPLHNAATELDGVRTGHLLDRRSHRASCTERCRRRQEK